MARKAIANQKNPRDHNTRGGKVVLPKHKGNIPAKLPRLKTMKGK